MNSKADARNAALRRRRAMPLELAQQSSHDVCGQALCLPEFSAAPALYAYIAVRNEVSAHTIIKAALAMGKRVYCPRVESETLRWGQIRTLKELLPGAFGIPEPPRAAPSPTIFEPTDLCLVPGVCFRADGHRLGQGGGYYDRFLKTFPGVTVGLAHDWQVADTFTPEAHDVRVQIIVSGRRVLRPAAERPAE